MSPPPIKIRIGASVDAGEIDRAFKTVAQKAGQAEKAIQRERKRSTSMAEQEAAKQLKAHERLAKAAMALDRQRSTGLFQQFKAQEAAADRSARMQERSQARSQAAQRREVEKTARAAARALAAEQRTAERAARQAQRVAVRQGESFARRTSHRATRFLMPEAPLGSMAMRGLGSVARGAGIDFSVQGAVSRVVGLQQSAIDLSNSGYQAGAEGANGKRVDPNALIAQARSVGGQFGIDSNEVLAGLAQYQKIAGDLETGRQTLFQMAQLSKATGTSLEDMAAATANVSNGLGDIPDKASAIDEVMRTIAGQGKLGAVEISDMAVQMARVAAAASAFSGDRATNIQKMGALAQIARAEGGAPSAAEATRSLGGFANTMKKGARISAFRKEGIDVFSDKTHTKIKDPIELIKESLMQTGGDLEKMNKLFMDIVGARTVTGLQKTFVGAGGGQAGLAKVDEQIARMMKAQLSKEEVKTSAGAASETTAAKAARFQNEWDRVTEEVMASLVPALEQAGPALLDFAKVVGSVSTWAVKNPATAIGAAIGVSIARAGIESTLRAGIERMILGANSSRAEGVGKLVSGGGALGLVGGLAVTTLMVGQIYAEQLYDETSEQFSSGVGKAARADDLEKPIEQAIANGNMDVAKKLTEKQLALREGSLQDISNSSNLDGFAAMWDTIARNTGTTLQNYGFENPNAAADKASAALLAEQVAATKSSRDLLARIAAATEGAAMPAGDNSGTGTRVSQ